jgi:hypothetical protein
MRIRAAAVGWVETPGESRENRAGRAGLESSGVRACSGRSAARMSLCPAEQVQHAGTSSVAQVCQAWVRGRQCSFGELRALPAMLVRRAASVTHDVGPTSCGVARRRGVSGEVRAWPPGRNRAEGSAVLRLP